MKLLLIGNTLFIIIHYNFNTNIHNLLKSIQMFSYAYCSQSQQNIFKIFLIIDGFYSLIFPVKSEEINLFLTVNYSQISKTIQANIEGMFKLYDSFTSEQSRINASPFNQIFKKILLEINQSSMALKKNYHVDLKLSNRIIIISDCGIDDGFDYEQKYLYLLKKAKAYIDCIHLGEHRKEYNNKLESIAFYSGGVFENVKEISGDNTDTDTIMKGEGHENARNNLGQILLQQFLLFPEDRKVKYSNNITNTTPVSTASNQMLKCDSCPRNDISMFFYPYKNMFLCSNCFASIEKKLKSSQ